MFFQVQTGTADDRDELFDLRLSGFFSYEVERVPLRGYFLIKS
jgi:hypothetical protein